MLIKAKHCIEPRPNLNRGSYKKFYSIYPKYSNRPEKSVDPDQTAPEKQFDQVLHCCPVRQHLLDTSPGSQMDLSKFYDEWGKQLRCPNF